VRRAPVIALLAAAAAPGPAAADTVARRTPAVGPKIAGAQTVWGEETRSGGVRLMAAARKAPPRVVYRLANSGAPRTRRSFVHAPWSLSASPTHVVAMVVTYTTRQDDSDAISTAGASGAVGGPFGAVRLLSGRTPSRGDQWCDGVRVWPDWVAADGTRIAVSEAHGTDCDPSARQARISIHDGDSVMTVPVAGSSGPRLRLAGRYLAWIERDGGVDESLVLYDLQTGAEVLRERHYVIDDLDLDADGTVAFIYADRVGARRLAVMRAGTPGRLVLARGVSDRVVALAAGRVLYEKLDRGDFRSRLLLRELDGGVRRLATFTPRRRRTGDLDLSADRAVWAAQKTRSADYEAQPSGPARIVSRPL
jgi:hypothetical protein